MRRFLDRCSGRTLTLHVEPEMVYGKNRMGSFMLVDEQRDDAVGEVSFRICQADSELSIQRIDVFGHSNAADAHNPFPGVGRLLMYLACRHASTMGLSTLRLVAKDSAIGFYTRMGLRADVHRPPPRMPAVQFVGNKLNRAWLDAFDDHFSMSRDIDEMTSEIFAVLSNIEGLVAAQWQEITA